MAISTCSGAISFSRQLETESAGLYEGLARRFEGESEFFLSLAKENKKFITQIERAYYGVITDALEGCFAFDLQTEEYELKISLPEQISFKDAVATVLGVEEKILGYYGIAAEQSKHLMADIPRSFTLVAKKRGERIPKIKALLEK
jgi:hypothetical protein